uniref:DUF2147 domain-containing protein n=1 Tax=Rhodopseudomonas palustris (strain BisA53) TaxID=316055 RepID=Q07QL8_RHOP5
MTGSLCPALAGDPTGDWNVKDGVANIRVAECNGSMWGAVVWEKIQGGRDKNNPDPAKVGRPTLGMLILFDMKRTTAAEQWNGKVYNAKDGQTYDASIKLLGPDQLAIEGCVLGFLCGGETWSRVGPPIPSSPSNLKGPKARETPSTARAPAPVKPLPPSARTGASTTTGQAKAAQGADPVGDICLLPELTGFAH